MSKVFMVAKCRDFAVSAPSGLVNSIDCVTQEALSQLMVDAYRGTADWEDGDDINAALTEIRSTQSGDYGPFLDYASGVIKADSGETASALLATLFENRPTIIFLFTGKSQIRKGYATTLIRNAAGKLLQNGFEEIALFVSPDNPAIRLYQQLGFTSR